MKIHRVVASAMALSGLCVSAPSLAQEASAKVRVQAASKQDSAGPQFDGTWRTYLLSTTNQGDLKDWVSLATGGNLGVRSPRFWGFSVGVRGYTSLAVAGNSSAIDPVTGRPSRYEIGLYDVTDPTNKEIVILGEAYLDASYERVEFWAGRRKISTPLFNPQDGRMIPSLAQGGFIAFKPLAGLKLQSGFISHVAPRSTGGFHSIEQSVGLYAQGRAVDGSPSSYAGQVKSAGLFVGAASYQRGPVSVSVWDFAVQNVFNTIYSEVWLGDRKEPVSKDAPPIALGLQLIAQQRIKRGGLAPQSDQTGAAAEESSYFEQARSYVFGLQTKWRPAPSWLLQLSYNRITGQGRFLFPREWGREPLFSFMKRERSEGNGDQHSATVEVEKSLDLGTRGRISTRMGNGIFLRPDPSQPALNKYALSSLYQMNLDTFYHLSGALSGLSFEALVVYKVALVQVTQNPLWVQNKVNMISWNLIANYEF
jgi:hypothetical protein